MCMPRHLINFKDWSRDELLEIIDKSIDVKRNPEKYRSALEGKSLAMIFQKTSTRTRVSFEVAMTQLGGHAIYLDWRTTQFVLADIRDEVRYLSRNVDCIMARLLKNSDLMLMAEASRVPVINGCDEKYHPCQAITDLMTMKEKKGTLEGVKLVYIGVHNNVCNSLIEICTKLGVEITTVTPIIHEPAIDHQLLEEAKKSGFYKTETDVKKAVKDADFVYTDTWVDMELFLDPKFKEEKEKRIKLMMPYQVNSQLLAESKALIMHDMPIHRGYEISGEAVESPRSIIYEQAENRLYTAKAILLKLLEKF
ncbi:MAG TPA: ornithine carbamoyltransferase [Candidatus Bathyarchaeota archaeon]|nr:ornithine carbamoyltransferase [Candidatus Bathyarchaeota archaeon]